MTNRGLLPGAPVPTGTGLTPAGSVQLPGRNIHRSLETPGRTQSAATPRHAPHHAQRRNPAASGSCNPALHVGAGQAPVGPGEGDNIIGDAGAGGTTFVSGGILAAPIRRCRCAERIRLPIGSAPAAVVARGSSAPPMPGCTGRPRTPRYARCPTLASSRSPSATRRTESRSAATTTTSHGQGNHSPPPRTAGTADRRSPTPRYPPTGPARPGPGTPT